VVQAEDSALLEVAKDSVLMEVNRRKEVDIDDRIRRLWYTMVDAVVQEGYSVPRVYGQNQELP
jgi:hypothetical protein